MSFLVALVVSDASIQIVVLPGLVWSDLPDNEVCLVYPNSFARPLHKYGMGKDKIAEYCFLSTRKLREDRNHNYGFINVS